MLGWESMKQVSNRSGSKLLRSRNGFTANWKSFLVLTFLINENNGAPLLLSVPLLLLHGPTLPAAIQQNDFVPLLYRHPS